MNLDFVINGKNDSAMRALEQVRTGVANTSRSIEQNASGLDSMFKKLAGTIATTFAGYKLQQFASSIVEVRKEFQSLEISFQSLLGSQEKGTKMFKDITDFATSTPLLEKDLANAAQTLLGFNIEAEKILPTLKAIGDVSMGDSQRFQSLTLAFAQATSAGKLMGQDLLQMINAGFNPLSEISRTTGKSISELKDEMSQGKISAEMLEQAFISATSEGGKFNGMLEAQSKTLKGASSNLEGAVQKLENAIGEKFEKYLVDATNSAYEGLNELTEKIEDFDMSAFMEEYATTINVVKSAIIGLVAAYGTWKAAELAMVAITKAQALWESIQLVWSLRKYLNLATAAQYAFNLAANKNPYVLLASVIIGVVTALVSMSNAQDEVSEKMDELDEKIKEQKKELEKLSEAHDTEADVRKAANDQIAEQISKIEILKDKVHDETASQEERKKAIEQLKAIAPGYNATLSAEGELHEYNTQAINDQIAALEKLALQQAVMDKKKEIAKNKLNAKIDLKTAEDSEKNAQKAYDAAKSKRAKNPFTGAQANYQTAAQAKETELKKKELEKAQNDVKIQKQTIANADRDSKILDKIVKDEKIDLTKPTAKTTKNQNNTGGNKNNGKKSGGKSTGKSDAQREAEERAEANKKIKEEEQDWSDKMAELGKEAARLEWQARIDEMNEGTDKELEALRYRRQAELDEIEKQKRDFVVENYEHAKTLWEAAPKNKKKSFDATHKVTDDAYKLTDEQQRVIDAKTRSAKAKAKAEDAKAKQDQLNAERDALVEYLKMYGDYQEQRLAIAKEYDAKIAKATTAGEKLSLTQQKKAELAKIDAEERSGSLGMEDVFAHLESQTIERLNDIKAKLQDLVASGTLDLMGYKEATDQIDRVNSAIVAAEAEQGGLLSSLITKSAERRKLELDVASALERQKNVAQALQNATDKRDKSQSALVGLFGGKLNTDDAKVGNANDIMALAKEMFGENSDKYKEVEQALADFATATDDANKAEKNKQKADDDVANATAALKKRMGDLKRVVADFAESIQGAITNINALPGLFETLGFDSESGVGKAVNDLAKGANAGMAAMQDFASGNYIGAAKNALQSIGSLGSAGIGTLFGYGNSAKMEEHITELTNSNELLAKSISSLKETISDADNTERESIEAYQKARDAEVEWEKNQREAINARASEYSNTGHGFLGLKGMSSFNYNLDKNGANWWVWQAFNSALRSNGINKSINSSSGLWGLTPEEMKILRDFAPSAWQELIDTKGQNNPKDLLNDYIERSGMLDNLTDALNEKLTGYSWDGFKSSFNNMLKDLKSDVTDFTDFINELLSNAIVESLVNNEFKARIQALYDMIADYSKDGITDSEAELIREYNNALAKDMLERRNEYVSMGLIKGDGSSQSATANGASSITYEQADLLVGRVTALQIQGEQRNALATAISESLRSMASASVVTGSAVSDIRNMMVTSNSYLEDIAKYIKATYLDFGGRLNEINTNIKAL